MKKTNAFLLGTLLGAGVMALFAPKTGKELQKDLKVKFDEVQEKVKTLDVEETKDYFLGQIEEVKTMISEFDLEASKKEVEKRATDIKERLDSLLSRVETVAQDVTAHSEGVVEAAEEDFKIVVNEVADATETVIENVEEAVDTVSDELTK